VCYNIPKLSIELKKKDELNVGFYLYESILNQLIINLIIDCFAVSELLLLLSFLAQGNN